MDVFLFVSKRAYNLLEQWWRKTREANVKALYPDVGHRWVKRGLAWRLEAVGFIVEHGKGGRRERKTPDWEEAGYAFLRACESPMHERVTTHFLFVADERMARRDWWREKSDAALVATARRYGIGVAACRAMVASTLRAYQDECERRGLLSVAAKKKGVVRSKKMSEQEGGEVYYTTLKEIADHFGITVPTLRKWIKEDGAIPISRSPSGGYLARPDDLDEWHNARAGRASSSQTVRDSEAAADS